MSVKCITWTWVPPFEQPGGFGVCHTMGVMSLIDFDRTKLEGCRKCSSGYSFCPTFKQVGNKGNAKVIKDDENNPNGMKCSRIRSKDLVRVSSSLSQGYYMGIDSTFLDHSRGFIFDRSSSVSCGLKKKKLFVRGKPVSISQAACEKHYAKANHTLTFSKSEYFPHPLSHRLPKFPIFVSYYEIFVAGVTLHYFR